MPLILGVTGSIATGKSLVCQTLVDLGAVHCDADKLVHRLYDPGTPGFDRVVAEFGEGNPPPTHAWFVGYRGNIAFAVVVEDGGVGGQVAAPLAAGFLNALG